MTKCHEQSRLSQKGQQRRPQPLSNGRKDVLCGGRTTAKILKVIPCLILYFFFFFFLNPHQQNMDRALLNKTELYVHGGCKNKTKMLAPCITLMHFEEEEQKSTRYKNSVRPNMCVFRTAPVAPLLFLDTQTVGKECRGVRHATDRTLPCGVVACHRVVCRCSHPVPLPFPLACISTSRTTLCKVVPFPLTSHTAPPSDGVVRDDGFRHRFDMPYPPALV